MDFSNIKVLKFGNREVSTLYIGGRIVWSKSSPSVTYAGLHFIAEEPNTKISITANGSRLEYSTDDAQTWTKDFSSGITLQKAGDHVCLRCISSVSSWRGSTFKIYRGKAKANGDLRSIYDKTMTTTSLASYGAYQLFLDCQGLTEAPDLNWTSADGHSIEAIFQGCTNLRKVGNFGFTGTLPGGFAAVFVYFCPNLKEVPYDFFENVSGTSSWSLGKAFAGTGIKKAPLIGFTPTSSNSMINFFENCTQLEEITVGWTSWPETSAISNWVSGVASTGKFIITNAILPIEYGVNRIPEGWTVERVIDPREGVEYTTIPAGKVVNTGFIPNQDTSVLAEVIVNGVDDYFYGCWASDWDKLAYCVCNDSFGVYSAYDSNNCGTTGTVLSKGEHTIYQNKNITLIDNGSSFEKTHTYTTFSTSPYPLYLGGQNRKGSKMTHTPCTFKSVKIYDNGTLVRDFVPCKDDSGMPKLKDTLTGTIYDYI